MSEQPIRVLHIVSVMDRGGIETFLMNIYSKIDRSKVQFDFLATREQTGVFDEEIRSLGGKVFNIPHIHKVGLLQYRKNVINFFESHKNYKMIHCHMNTWSGFFLPIAKKCNIPIRIAHSHTTQNAPFPRSIGEGKEYFFKKFMKIFIKNAATHYFACGYDAGKCLYGKSLADKAVTIIKNGVDTEAIRYDEEIAQQVRSRLSITKETLVVGHIGSMRTVKNHVFLLDIFAALQKQVPNSILCLVGDGSLRPFLEERVESKGLTEQVKFLGIRDDVYNLLKGFDVFVMPSLFEGFPVSVVEAQAAALTCVISDSITKEVDMGMDLIDFVGLNHSPEYWAEVVLTNRYADRTMSTDQVMALGYDSQTTANWLEKFYISETNKNDR